MLITTDAYYYLRLNTTTYYYLRRRLYHNYNKNNYDGDDDYYGYCNNDCPRKKAHTKVSRGLKRFDSLTKLKSEALTAQPRAKQDFWAGEGV